MAAPPLPVVANADARALLSASPLAGDRFTRAGQAARKRRRAEELCAAGYVTSPEFGQSVALDNACAWAASGARPGAGGLPAGLAPLHATMAAIQATLAAMQADVALLRPLPAAVATLQADVGTLKADVATLQADMATVQADMALLRPLPAAVATLQANMATVQADVAALQANVGTMQADMATVQVDMGTVQADVALLQPLPDAVVALQAATRAAAARSMNSGCRCGADTLAELPAVGLPGAPVGTQLAPGVFPATVDALRNLQPAHLRTLLAHYGLRARGRPRQLTALALHLSGRRDLL